ncbi:MAG: response regulator transcription factor [Rhodobacteraceae bacterium]|nr:response regulator transcription factor [Paracoccaceae bacterium]
MKYLLVEDNEDLARAICSRMSFDGHVIDHAATVSGAIDFISTYDYDLILLDIMLPDGDGREFLKEHRAREKDTPVIILTARSEVSDRISVLDLGADDYITKPFDHEELQARCRAVLRRKHGTTRNVKKIGDITFDSVSGILQINGQDIMLRNRELRLLELFLSSPNQIFSKQKLADRLFSYVEDVSENAIEVYVGRIRKHLEGSSVRITTLRGLGYRLDHG